MMLDYGKIEYFVIDVDGTMTDAGIYYDDSGNELKKFCTKDAAGFFTAHAVGMKIIVLTGRECKAVTRRMQEMSVEFICQNIKDKKNFLISFLISSTSFFEAVPVVSLFTTKLIFSTQPSISSLTTKYS